MVGAMTGRMDPEISDRVLYAIETRHSSRAPFDPTWHVTGRELARVLEAARWAPTAHNFRLVTIDDPSVLAELGRIGLRAEAIAGAPLVIVVLYDPTSREDPLGMMSLGCVMENMWLAAHAEHLDVQIVSSFAAEGVESEVKRVLAIPPPWRVAFAMRLGHALPSPHPQRVRRHLASFVGRNRF